MTNFKKTQLTAKGKVLAAKTGININFTKVETGCGVYSSDEDVEPLTALKSKVQTFSINSVDKKTDILVNIKFVISNQVLQEEYLLTEIGIYAIDPDEGEVLYAVCYAVPEDSQKILPYNGEFVSAIVMSANIKVSSESNVSFQETGTYALQEDLMNVQVKISIMQQAVNTLEAHAGSTVYSEDGAHGFRFYNDRLQYYDKVNEIWMDVEVRDDSISGVVIGSNMPEDTKLLWIDIANGGVAKYYDGADWVPTAVVLGSKPSNVVGAMWYE